MRWLKNQPWVDPKTGRQDPDVEWNMWRLRQPPFHDLEEGDTVFTVEPRSGRPSEITAQARVTRVVAAAYGSKDEAWKLIKSLFAYADLGWTRRDFIEQSYTAEAPDSGWLLAFTYDVVREMNIDLPEELVLLGNGWLGLDQTAGELKKWGILPAGPSVPPGPGDDPVTVSRRTDPLARKAVELHAMKKAKRHLRTHYGWDAKEIEDTSATKPYDLELRRGSRTVRVEVKGLSGGLGPVVLTRGEVKNARNFGHVMLIVVHGIELETGENETKAKGGEVAVWDRWTVDDDDLEPLAYEYRLPPKKE